MTKIKFKKGRDINGNALIKVTREGFRGFSIQSNGNLPMSYRNDVIAHNITMNEVQTYVEQFGTPQQKSLMGLSENLEAVYELGNYIKKNLT